MYRKPAQPKRQHRQARVREARQVHEQHGGAGVRTYLARQNIHQEISAPSGDRGPAAARREAGINPKETKRERLVRAVSGGMGNDELLRHYGFAGASRIKQEQHRLQNQAFNARALQAQKGGKPTSQEWKPPKGLADDLYFRQKMKEAGVGSSVGTAGRILRTTAADLGGVAIGVPLAPALVAKSLAQDVGQAHDLRSALSYPHTAKLLKNIGIGTAESFTPKQLKEHPAVAGVTALGLFAGGVGAASRVGAAGGALRAGEGVSAALTRPTYKGGSLLHKTPAGTIDLPGGAQALGYEAPYLRGLQRRRLRRVIKHAQEGTTPPYQRFLPESIAKELHPRSVIGREIRAREGVLGDIGRARWNALEARMQGLSTPEHTASRIIGIEGIRALHHPEKSIAREVDIHEGYAKKAERRADKLEASPAGAGTSKKAKRIATLRSYATLNREVAKDIAASLPVLKNPTREFLRNTWMIRRGSRAQEQTMIAAGKLSPEGASWRRAKIAHLYGAADLKDVPMTKADAEARLAHLEKQNAAFERAVIGSYKSVAPETQAALNKVVGKTRMGGRSVEGRVIGAPLGKADPLSEQFLNKMIEDIVTKAPNSEGVRRYLGAQEEISALREKLTGQHLPGEEPAAVDYGTMKVPEAPAGSFYFPTAPQFTYETRAVKGSPVTRRPSQYGVGPVEQSRYLMGTTKEFTGKGTQKGGVTIKPGHAVAMRGFALERMQGAERFTNALLKLSEKNPKNIPEKYAIRIRAEKGISEDLRKSVAAAYEHSLSGDSSALARAEQTLRAGIEAPPGFDGPTRWVDSRYIKEFASSAQGLPMLAKINTPFRLGGVYFRPAYIATNRPQNFIMRHMTQGLRSNRPAAASVRQLRKSHGPETEAVFEAMAGESRTMSYEPAHGVGNRLGRVAKRSAEKVQKLTDSNERYLAVMNEAAQMGYDTIAKQRQLALRPGLENARVEIARRARKNMVDFDSITPGERNLSDFIYFYPWISRGGFAWSGRFLAQHPTKSAALAQVTQEARREKFGKIPGPIPSWMYGEINTPYGISNPNPVAPFSTVPQTINEIANPGSRTGANLADILGTPWLQFASTDYRKFPQTAERMLAPATLLSRLGTGIGPPPSKTFPKTGLYSGLSRFLVGGPAPQHPDWKELHKQGMSTLSAEQKVPFTAQEQDRHIDNLIKKGLIQKGAKPAYRMALDVYNARELANSKIDKATKDKPRAREVQKMVALLDLLDHYNLWPKDQLRKYRTAYIRSRAVTAEQIQSDRAWFWSQTLGGVVSDYNKKVGH